MLVTFHHFGLVDFGWSSLSRTPMWSLSNSDMSTKFPASIFSMSFAGTGGTKEKLSAVKLSRPAAPVRIGVKAVHLWMSGLGAAQSLQPAAMLQGEGSHPMLIGRSWEGEDKATTN